MAEPTNAPNPGSNEAIAQGCRCPQIDNHYGNGWGGMPGYFIYTAGCPLHWPAGSNLGPFVAREPLEAAEGKP